VQAALHRQASTDLQAQLEYQDRIADFHARLRTFHYPYLFNELRFGSVDFASQPRFSLQAGPARTPAAQLLGLLLIGALAVALGAAAAGRVRPTRG
jgi:ABC-2 type transport system permease protein